MSEEQKVDEPPLTVDDFARACNVSDKTVRRWIKGGDLAYNLVGPAKRIRIPRAELARIMNGSKQEGKEP